MDTTTVKIHRGTKSALDELKSNNESYDDVITNLISTSKNKNLKKELIEAYKSMGKKDLETLKEWEIASNEII